MWSTRLCCLMAAILAGPVAAQERGAEAGLQAGIRQVNDGELDAAILTLDALIQKLTPTAAAHAKELSQAYLYKGVALVGLLQEEPAKASFQEALRYDPGLRLVKGRFPDRVIRVFEAARKGRTESVMKRPSGAPKKAGIGAGAVAAIVGGVLAAGGAAAVAAGGGGSNGPPTTPTLNVDPASPALVSATNISFTASATDPDGDALSYAWNFGDAGIASGSTVTHVFSTEGTFNVQVTVSDGRGGSAAASGTVTARSLAGCWVDITPASKFLLRQSGAQVTGVGGFSGLCGDGADTVQAVVAHPRNVTQFTVSSPGGFTVTYNGQVDNALDLITLTCIARTPPGPCSGILSSYTLRRQ